MKYKKGFTLMEILAVLLVIAVIASFAMPLIKSIRRQMNYQKAKSAAVQLAEAVRSLYADAKGCFQFDGDDDGFSGADAGGGSCPVNNPVKTGVPICPDGAKVNSQSVFACGYLSTKMFVDLPYTFKVEDPRQKEQLTFVTGTENITGEDARKFIVNWDMTITEDEGSL